MKTNEQWPQSRETQSEENWLEAVREQVASLRFGAVHITVHEASVVQSEKTERFRFRVSPANNAIARTE